mgnify:CR=1 FL=1
MNEMYIISFNSTHQAIKCDKAFGKNEIDYTVLPTPREISQSCGMSIRFVLEDMDKIKEIIAEQLGVSEDEIAMETTFEDLGADSLDLFQIITELEDAFDMEFANDDAENIKTVGDAVEYVKNATNK